MFKEIEMCSSIYEQNLFVRQKHKESKETKLIKRTVHIAHVFVKDELKIEGKLKLFVYNN